MLATLRVLCPFLFFTLPTMPGVCLPPRLMNYSKGERQAFLQNAYIAMDVFFCLCKICLRARRRRALGTRGGSCPSQFLLSATSPWSRRRTRSEALWDFLCHLVEFHRKRIIWGLSYQAAGYTPEPFSCCSVFLT